MVRMCECHAQLNQWQTDGKKREVGGRYLEDQPTHQPKAPDLPLSWLADPPPPPPCEQSQEKRSVAHRGTQGEEEKYKEIQSQFTNRQNNKGNDDNNWGGAEEF